MALSEMVQFFLLTYVWECSKQNGDTQKGRGEKKMADEQDIEALLLDAVEKVRTEADPVELTDLKKLFKKYVPFTLRGYVTAYLLKVLLDGNRGGRSRFQRKTRKEGSGRPERKERTERNERAPRSDRTVDSTPSPRVTIDPSLADNIFINVGRNRGVYPRDLVSLLCQAAEVERERIGDIRVLDNYSFVQIYSEDAEKIIDSLNGKEYRNRRLVVNYSRKKDDSDVSESDQVSEDVELESENEEL